jgi:hypothetical protein
MLLIRVRIFLIACFPAMVASAFCIFGNCAEVGESESSPIADSSGFPGLMTLGHEQTDLAFALDSRTQLDTKGVFGGRCVRVKSHEAAHGAMVRFSQTLFELTGIERSVRVSRGPTTALAVVAPPIHPHAPPVGVS